MNAPFATLAALCFVLAGLAACSDEPLSAADGGADGGAASGNQDAGDFGNPEPMDGSMQAPFRDGGVIGVPDPCQGLECDRTTCVVGDCTQKPCMAGVTTTLSGLVHEPAGLIPLYNVMVFVPNGEVAPFEPGVSCDRCDLTKEKPVASALTDTLGKFTLENVPVGENVPLVIQIGRWRRQVAVAVSACAENQIDDQDLTRLPRNQSEGDIPLIAITTGGADSMECLPFRLGIDPAEFTTEAGNGRIHLYSGHDNGNGTATAAFDPALNGGATLTRSTVLWNDVKNLSRYDLVILSCEGATIEDEKPPAARAALFEYAEKGGRVFASHWHRIWFSDGPDPVPSVGTWSDRDNPADPSVGTINTSFPKGKALAKWLVNVGASTVNGELEIQEPRDNVQAVDGALATQWITVQNDNYPQDPNAVQYLSFNAPVAAPDVEQCGRVVYTDLHVSATGADRPGDLFPTGCENRELSSQEKAVAFMLFDLSACLVPDEQEPTPPPVVE
jgi:hypothetical protein